MTHEEAEKFVNDFIERERKYYISSIRVIDENCAIISVKQHVTNSHTEQYRVIRRFWHKRKGLTIQNLVDMKISELSDVLESRNKKIEQVKNAENELRKRYVVK